MSWSTFFKALLEFLDSLLNPTPPVPEPPPPEPEPEPIPEPEPSIKPSDYVTLDAVPRIRASLIADLQENIWRGHRDLLYVSRFCSDALGILDIDFDSLIALAGTGADLDREGAGFLNRLSKTNRRCGTLPDFCGRTDVNKRALSDFRLRLSSHLATCRILNAKLSGQPGYGTAYDSLKGWCEYRNRQEN